MANTLSRRSFIKAGLIGTFALATAGGLYRATRPTLPAGFVLDEETRSALSAIIPVVLKDAIDSAPATIDAVLMQVRDAIMGLPLATQKEVQDLFGLLTLGPTRRFLVGLSDDWQHAKSQDVAAFLQNWRMSRLSLLQSAYQALHDLITGSWYGSESSWEAIGYPGPIKELS